MTRLADAQERLRARAAALAAEVIAPRAAEVDRSELYPWDNVTALGEAGFLGMTLPVKYGGRGLGYLDAVLVIEEIAKVCGVTARIVVETNMGAVGAVMAYGSEAQKRLVAEAVLAGDKPAICVTEPGAGSAATEMTTRAERRGDTYVINGKKIWITGAQYAERMILLARTDPEAPKHKGISYFLLDMKTPGVTVKPLVNMAGTSGFNEVFFDNVRVPRKDLLGEENRGWYVGTTTLDFERSSIGTSIAQGQSVENLVLWVQEHRRGTLPETAKMVLAERSIEAETARLMSYRVISLQNRGQVPNHEASAVKIYAGELNQRIANTAMNIMGLPGLLTRGEKGSANDRHAPNKGRFGRVYLQSVASTIAGGTSEINRGIIATRGLGLPRG